MIIKPPSQRKYRNRTTVYKGHKYMSTKEAKYAQALDWQIKIGEITKWQRQIPFDIEVEGVHICKYICDFVVYHKSGRIEYVDVKGYKGGAAYNVFSLKKKLMLATYGIDIVEV